MISPTSVATYDGAIVVKLSALPSLATLAHAWRSLEQRAKFSFFVSWSWIGPWLSSLPDNIRAQLLLAMRGDRVVGMAVIVDAPIRGLPMPFGRAAWLHTTGQPGLDGIAIEHNGFLVDAEDAHAVEARMLAFMLDEARPWRRVIMPLMGGPKSPSTVEASDRFASKQQRKPCWTIDLQKARSHANGLLGLLSAKARANLRRTLRACEALGDLQVDEARDLAVAQQYLASLLKFHERRWRALATPSAFAAPFTQRFHAALLGEAFERGEVQVLRVRAGARDVGYLYSFVHDGRVSFYQSGFDYGLLDSRFSPGLATLLLGIDYNARRGHAVFDFLGGSVKYKATLATDCEELLSIVVDRRSAPYQAESWMRSHLLPIVRRASGNSPDTRKWLMKWVRRIAVVLSLPLLLLCLDACAVPQEEDRPQRKVGLLPLAA